MKLLRFFAPWADPASYPTKANIVENLSKGPGRVIVSLVIAAVAVWFFGFFL